ncbi:MAG: hypothetical protein NZ879_07735 [Archaeoglobaceae archaeon]|nr:hypothetical protein [Archaeoglobaceae archaeon]MDW8118856.1 hypothetical protein [Archaeoglobaceae archaeon]
MKEFLSFLTLLLLAVLMSFCAEESPCKADVENAKCSIAKDGIATLSNLNLPSNAKLINARISPCEVTGKLWSCEEIGWKVKSCEIISETQPFKAKCPIESGAWSVRFTILKPKGCPDPVNPQVKWDCEQVVRIYQNV